MPILPNSTYNSSVSPVLFSHSLLLLWKSFYQIFGNFLLLSFTYKIKLKDTWDKQMRVFTSLNSRISSLVTEKYSTHLLAVSGSDGRAVASYPADPGLNPYDIKLAKNSF